ncbi:MAG: hypothetical protein LBH59_08410, partial [Planctomycetaceae bacterium]|nr:hypothetical protein [Planctomycetaceae bacterium]
MSFFQPLITTAFSNYGVMRSSYAYRDFEVTGNAATDKRVNGSDKVNQNTESQKNQSIKDPDWGKIKSASGDILDISDKGRAAADLFAKSKIDNIGGDKNITQVESEQIESKSSSVETKDTRISVTDSSPETLESLDKVENKSADEVNELNSKTDLTEEEQEQVRKLEARDAEVRQHEAAHLAVAGQYAQGGAEYTYQTGPDGKKYAIGGSVSIDVSEVEGDPEATIAKMRQVAAAATAPAEPSNQDLKVASAARQTEAKARMELAQSKTENINNTTQKTNEINNNETTNETKNNNSKQNIADKFLKSAITAYANQ